MAVISKSYFFFCLNADENKHIWKLSTCENENVTFLYYTTDKFRMRIQDFGNNCTNSDGYMHKPRALLTPHIQVHTELSGY